MLCHVSYSVEYFVFYVDAVLRTNPHRVPLAVKHAITTLLSNTPAGRRFFGGFLMGGSSVGRVIKLLSGVQQNCAGQCEIVGGGGGGVRAIVPEARYAMTNGHC